MPRLPTGRDERRSGIGFCLSDCDSTRWLDRALGLVVRVSRLREIVDTVGLPLEGLFWWAEDAEYCEWRIPQAGFPRRIIDEAVVQHDAIRQEGVIPRWKYYYESRNSLYYHLHVMHRVGRYPKKITGLVMRALLRQKGDRIGCLRAIYRGLYDGAFGRLRNDLSGELLARKRSRPHRHTRGSSLSTAQRWRPERVHASGNQSASVVSGTGSNDGPSGTPPDLGASGPTLRSRALFAPWHLTHG